MTRVPMADRDLIDNRGRSLTRAVAALLKQSDRAQMVRGHLFVPGLADIVQKASRTETIRFVPSTA